MTLKEYVVKNNKKYLLAEWSSQNGNLTPVAVLITSSAKVWWTCQCGHCWKDSVKNRIAGKRCAICYPQQKIIDITKSPRVDLIGRKYGRLQVMEYAGIKKESLWNCQCVCGKQIVVMQSSLTSGKTTSCGCKQDEVRKANFYNGIHFVEGTCIERIAAKTTPQNNTSGFRGVNKRKNGRFRVSITFKGKRYSLGSYATLKEAIDARLAGEVMMDEFLKEYQNKMRGVG